MPNNHRIRSFVRRQGRLTKGQQRALQTLLPGYGLGIESGELDLQQVFSRQAPCILEVGFGMGQALLQMAATHPENNYIGIEVHAPGVGTLLQGIEKQQLTNVRIFNQDAIDVLQQCIPANSLSGLLLFFPDPWHKKRHHKRRIVQPGFVQLVYSRLQEKGLFHLATDWQNYAEHMLAVLSQAPGFNNQAGLGNYAERPKHRPLTKFEQRGLRLGHGVWDLMFEKIIINDENDACQ